MKEIQIILVQRQYIAIRNQLYNGNQNSNQQQEAQYMRGGKRSSQGSRSGFFFRTDSSQILQFIEVAMLRKFPWYISKRAVGFYIKFQQICIFYYFVVKDGNLSQSIPKFTRIVHFLQQQQQFYGFCRLQFEIDKEP
eukprot:TRINITY_DN10261_c0_g1_i10.p3 TRINITY_DN10261_c0_g1~~TRINITY_DN10261_c0_g1_i10.p3  ORF type:complete len:137 (+),score=7.60 TRINITY_DN10261_c0_g1_i10:25-435(+)